MAPLPVRQAIDNLLAQSTTLTTGQVAALAGVSRQAAQKQLKALVQAGHLVVEGRARAARYHLAAAAPVDDSPMAFHQLPAHEKGPASYLAQANALLGGEPVDDSAPAAGLKLTALAPLLTSTGAVDDSPRAGRVTLDVAQAGAEFRLSARILLCEVTAAELVVDFAGVEDVGDEFLDELLVRYAQSHPEVRFEIVNAAAAIRAAVASLAPAPAAERLAFVG